MASVKSALDCIGVDTNQDISILKHLFGFIGRKVPTDPTEVSISISMLSHINSLQGNHIHLNIIKVGYDLFTVDQIDDIDYAIFKTRNIYRAQDIGVGRVEHYSIDSSDSDGLYIIESAGDSKDLTVNWTFYNNGIDVFFVYRIIYDEAKFVGISPTPGPCDKDSSGRTGVVCDKDRGADATARTMAHEIGHYLGLGHENSDLDNLMCQSDKANSTRDSVELTDSQVNEIDDHCFVQNGC